MIILSWPSSLPHDGDDGGEVRVDALLADRVLLLDPFDLEDLEDVLGHLDRRGRGRFEVTSLPVSPLARRVDLALVRRGQLVFRRT